MVDNQEQTGDMVRGGLTARDCDEIRYLRFCGLNGSQIARKLGVARSTLHAFMVRNNLNAPIEAADAVYLEVLASFRDTNKRLTAVDLTASDHARLCATQVKLATLLMRFEREDSKLEEDGMSQKSKVACARLEAMNMEELRNEIRRLAGMELKALAGDSERDRDRGAGASPDEKPVFNASDAGSEAADGD